MVIKNVIMAAPTAAPTAAPAIAPTVILHLGARVGLGESVPRLPPNPRPFWLDEVADVRVADGTVADSATGCGVVDGVEGAAAEFLIPPSPLGPLAMLELSVIDLVILEPTQRAQGDQLHAGAS